MASLLHKTLIEVKISCCENPSAVASLRSLEPLQDLIERLHVDCVRDGCEEHEHASKKKCKYSTHPDFSSCELSNGNRIFCKSRKGLKYLSLWISAGELLTPLPMTGLDAHPNLEEIRIRVERDCRSGHKPSNRWAALLVILDCQRCSWFVYKRFCINHTMWAGEFEPVAEVLHRNLSLYELLIIGHHKNLSLSIKGVCRFQELVFLRNALQRGTFCNYSINRYGQYFRSFLLSFFF